MSSYYWRVGGKLVLNSIEIEEILYREGFKLVSNNKRAHGFDHDALDWSIYIKTPSGNTKAHFVRNRPFVINPELKSELLSYLEICGVDINIEDYYHNSNLKGYPKRFNEGKTERQYGIDIGFESDTSLLSFLDLLLGKSSRKPSATPEFDIEVARQEIDCERKTTKEALVEARLGQGKYRDDLLHLWKTCSVSDFSMKEFLRASHIKPWRDSNNTERLDKYNGLLLNPTLDIAFDRGFISFDDEGAIIVSERYADELSNMGIDHSLVLKTTFPQQLKYLSWHREHVLRK